MTPRVALVLGLLTASLALVPLSSAGTTSSGPFKYVQRDFNVPPFSQSKLEVARCPGRTHVYGGGMVVLFQDGIVTQLSDRPRGPGAHAG